MTNPAAALRRMLLGTGLRAVKVGPRSYRLEPNVRPLAREIVNASGSGQSDIIVSATKRRQPIGALGGNLEVVSFDTAGGEQDRRGDVSALANRISSLSSTALGQGRNKFFIRGISDSSFAGRTQSTVGEYLGETRLNFDAPDPGLLLYDVTRLELLKGPQGTLYGGGTLGGVLKIEPKRPDLAEVSGFLDIAASSTEHGSPGGAVASMFNVPLLRDKIALRTLVYRSRLGGYIDDSERDLADVNRYDVSGGRAQAHVSSGDWDLNLLGTHQRVAARDGNYAIGNLPPLTRDTTLAQPSSNTFDLLSLEIRGKPAGFDLVSATGLEHNSLASTFDGTSVGGDLAKFDDRRYLSSISQEFRLSRSYATGAGWLLGANLLAQRERNIQSSASPALRDLDIDYSDRRSELGLFGQITYKLGRILLTGGLRLSYSRFHASTVTKLIPGVPPTLSQSDLRPLPTVEASWSVRPGFTVSLGYRQGFRAGGVLVQHITASPGSDLPAGFTFFGYRPDFLRVANLSIELKGNGNLPFDLQATLSGADWSHIQADLLDDTGFVFTANSGNADLINLDLSGQWHPQADIALSMGVSISRGYYKAYGPFILSEIASVPRLSLYAGANWSRLIATNWTLDLEGRVTYRGRSHLGPGDLRTPQGDMVFSSLSARLSHGRYSGSLTIDNVSDDRSNLFGYGNPFTVRTEHQLTPQRPRTATIGLHAEF